MPAPSPPTGTTLLVNGRVHTPGSPVTANATAFAVTGDTIAWVGASGPALAMYPDAEVVDLDGAFVAPAFVDAHVHATASGLLLDGLDLTATRSAADLLGRVREFAARSSRALVWGHGWDETGWPGGRTPSRAELDEAAEGTPVYLSRVDVHSALVSSALLRQVPAAREAEGWSPDGPLTRAAHHHARGAARAALTTTQRDAAQRAFLRHAAARGIAAAHECAGPDVSGADDLAALLDLAADPDLPDVTGYWGERTDPATAADLGVAGLAGDLFVDGALGSRTAALTAPYTDDPTTSGARYLDAEQIAAHVVACTRAGIQAGFHVIGDAAVTALVEGLTSAERTVGLPALAGRHHRVEHLEMITARQAETLGRLGIVASVQPGFDAAWGGPDRMYARRLGPERGATLNPFAALASSGVTLAFGSDSPVTPVDPWATIRAAVHHRTPGHGITPRAAFTAHTRGGWRAAGHTDRGIGTLAPGAPATYAVWHTGALIGPPADDRVRRWSTDPRSGVPELPDLAPGAALPTCLRTVLRGHTIHDTGTLGKG